MTIPQTEWFKELRNKYNTGVTNTFMITGNIGDYAKPGISLVEYLKKELMANFDTFITYNDAEGGYFHKGEGQKETDRLTWSGFLKKMREVDKKNLILVEYPEFLIPEPVMGQLDPKVKNRLIDLHKLVNDKEFIHSDHLLLFVTETKAGIHHMFLNANSRTAILNIEFPDESERLEMINFLLDSSDKTLEMEVTVEQFAKITAGLSRVHIEDMILIAEDAGILERRLVLERKEELIRKEFGEVIEVFDTEGYSLNDFSGQEHLKQYHIEAVIEPMREGNTDFVPKGLLYMGPPGTGKTYFSRCLAGEAGINFVEFKMSKILDKYVGEAERNLEKAFNCFASLAPVGVFIDEVDQVLTRGGDDGNSVSRNLFGMFLSFMSEPDNRGKILWVGATNYPDRIDEALKRAGRFDKKMPFFPPSEKERVDVFKFHFGKCGLPYEIENYEVLATDTDGYTPAEIENIVVKTVELAHRRKLSVIDDELVGEAMSYIMTQQNSRIQEMVDIALSECNDLEFLPEKYRKKDDLYKVQETTRRKSRDSQFV